MGEGGGGRGEKKKREGGGVRVEGRGTREKKEKQRNETQLNQTPKQTTQPQSHPDSAMHSKNTPQAFICAPWTRDFNYQDGVIYVYCSQFLMLRPYVSTMTIQKSVRQIRWLEMGLSQSAACFPSGRFFGGWPNTRRRLERKEEGMILSHERGGG